MFDQEGKLYVFKTQMNSSKRVAIFCHSNVKVLKVQVHTSFRNERIFVCTILTINFVLCKFRLPRHSKNIQGTQNFSGLISSSTRYNQNGT